MRQPASKLIAVSMLVSTCLVACGPGNEDSEFDVAGEEAEQAPESIEQGVEVGRCCNNVCLTAMRPVRDGGQVVGGGRIENHSSTRIEWTAFVQRFVGGAWRNMDSRSGFTPGFGGVDKPRPTTNLANDKYRSVLSWQGSCGGVQDASTVATF